MTYPDQDGPTYPGVTDIDTPYDRVYINPPGLTHLNYRRFRMQVPTPHAGPVVMFFHPLNGNENSIEEKDPLRKMVDTWLNQGWVVVTPRSQTETGGPSNFGNQPTLDGISEIWDWLVVNVGPSGVLGFGSSMGGLVGFNVISDNQIPMFGLAVQSSVCDLEAIYYAGYQAPIRKAYNFTLDSQFLTATAGHDPMDRPVADYRNLPIRMYASTQDTQVPRVNHTDPMAARLQGNVAELKVVNCVGQHGTSDHFRDADVLTFYQRAAGVC